MASADVSWALAQFRDSARQSRYALARSYYLGDHPLAFATDKFRSKFWDIFRSLSDNLCPAVVDSLLDRLEVTGFGVGTMAQAQADDAWRIWKRNRMPLRANEVHRESLLTGDGYVIVWPSADQQAMIWPQYAHELAVAYDPEAPGSITMAAKLWQVGIGNETRVRLTLYFPDRLEKYVSRRAVRSFGSGSLKPAEFIPYMPEGSQVGNAPFATEGVIENPYGVVPVFHFPNKRLHQPGLSELLDVIPLQDALNKALADMMVAMEASGYRQRWVTGLDVEINEVTGLPKPPPFDLGVDKFVVASDPSTTFGEFQTSDLRQFLDVQESMRSEIARVSGTPLHYLFITKGDFPSGEAMKSAEARFTRKLRDRQVWYGNVWEDVMTFALKTEGTDVSNAEDRLQTEWENASPRSEREMLEVALMKASLGVSREQILRELGYKDELIRIMNAEKGAGIAATAAAVNSTSTPIDVRSLTGNGSLNVTPPR